jgi:hypothetical protein
MEKSSQTIQKPIQDRLRQASCITIESALRNKVDLNISWYDFMERSRIRNIPFWQVL